MSQKDDIKLYFSEAEDLIQSIEENILSLEEDFKNDKFIQNLFFAYHTLKGMSAMVGFENLSKFCHSFETFLDKNKEYDERVSKKDNFLGLLFESLDIVKEAINSTKSGKSKDLDGKILQQIDDTFGTYETEYEITFFQPIPSDQLDNVKDKKDLKFYKIFIELQSTCVFKKVRLFIIFRALNKIGRICSSNPDPDVLEKGNFDNRFEILFMSNNDSNQITAVLNEILEIENKVINEISNAVFYKEVTDFNLKYNVKLEKGDVRSEIEIKKTTKTEAADISIEIDDLASIDSKITSVKVNIETLETLMDYFGELVILKNQLNQILKERQDWKYSRLFDNMDKLFLEIQEIIFKLKLVRVDTTFRKYKRLVRDLAKETNKNINLILEGMEVEIDRKVLEELNSPLIHMLRNAVYHGIEDPKERNITKKSPSGFIKLKTYRRAGSVYIEVTDDGRGLNFELIRQKAIKKGLYTTDEAMELTSEELKKIIFLPGFTTLPGADEISGRGMGLAIVAEKIEELGGSVDIISEKGVGTTFKLDVPFTRAILKAQLFKVGTDLFAIPIENINQIYFFKRELIDYVKGEEHYRLEKKLVPFIRLDEYLDFLPQVSKEASEVDKTNSQTKIVIWCKKDENESAAFLIDQILQQIEVVIKPFRSKYSKFQEILGVTITGDGSICLILDVLNIISSKMKRVKEVDLVEIPQQIKN